MALGGPPGKESKIVDDATCENDFARQHHLKTDTEQFVNYHYDLPNYYRWAMFVGITILAIFIGPPFMNWPPLESMFDSSGAYQSLCTAGAPGVEVDANGILYCEAKTVEINKMAGFSVSVMFSFTFVAGILLDGLGSKVCTSCGMASTIIGWIFIAFSGVKFNGFKTGIFFVAAGCDPAFFGLLSVANLFPGYNSTIIAVLGSARSVSFAISIIMNAICENSSLKLREVTLIYAAMLAAWLVVVLVVLPPMSYPKTPPGVPLDYEPGEDKLSLKQELKKLPRISYSGFVSSTKTQFQGWFRQAATYGYVFFLPIALFTLMRNNYYSMTYESHLPNVKSFYTIMSPLSFIPCPLVGFIADRVSAAVCICILQTCGVISLVLGMIGSVPLEYLSVIFNWVFISFVASQFYCYVAAVYPQKQMGKLVGFALLFAGLTSLVTQNIYEFSSQGHLLAMDLLIVAFGVVSAVLAIGLYIFIERPQQRRSKIDADGSNLVKPDWNVSAV